MSPQLTPEHALKLCVFALIFLALLICLCLAQTWLEKIKYHNSITIETMNINNDNTVDSYYSQWHGSSLINNQYKNEHNNICNLPTLLFIRNHKTGGYMKFWEKKLKTHCNLQHPYFSIIDYNLFECHVSSNLSLQENENELEICDTAYRAKETAPIYMKSYWDYKPSKKESELIKISEKSNVHLIIISKLLDINSEKQSYIPIMSVRTPLQTILSGYNYHSQGAETKWTDANLTSGEAQYKRGSVPLLYCFKNVFSDIDANEYIINRNTTMYKEYKKGFVNNYSNITALAYGLYLEFARYVNCEWPLIIWLNGGLVTVQLYPITPIIILLYL